MADNRLRKLAQEAEQLQKATACKPVSLGLNQIEQSSKNLLQKTYREGGDQNSYQAEKMFARKGYEVKDLTRYLGEINTDTDFEPLDCLSSTDVQGFLTHEYELIVTSIIEEAEKNAVSAFDRSCSRNLESEWKKNKKSILQSRSQTQHTMSGDRSGVDESRRKYATIVMEYVQQAVKNEKRSFIEDCVDKIKTPANLNKCWTFLYGLSKKIKSFGIGKECKVAQAAKQLLEEQFLKGQSIDDFLKSINDKRDEKWARLYYHLRSGAWRSGSTEIINGNRDYPMKGEEPEIDRFVANYFDSEPHVDRRRLRGAPGQLKSKRSWKGYKRAVFAIVTREPLYHDNFTINCPEDFLWLRLNALQDVDNHYNLRHLQMEVTKEIKSQKRPTLVKFYMNLMACNFSEAIKRLYEESGYDVDAVHFAIAFTLIGMVTSNADHRRNDNLDCYVNIADVQEMVSSYARHFWQEQQPNFQSNCYTALSYLAIPELDMFKDKVKKMAIELTDKLQDRKQDLGILMGYRKDFRSIRGELENPNLGHAQDACEILEELACTFKDKMYYQPFIAVEFYFRASTLRQGMAFGGAHAIKNSNEMDEKIIHNRQEIVKILVDQFAKKMKQNKEISMDEEVVLMAKFILDDFTKKVVPNFRDLENMWDVFVLAYYPYKLSEMRNVLKTECQVILQNCRNFDVLSFQSYDKEQKLSTLNTLSNDLKDVFIQVVPRIALKCLIHCNEPEKKEQAMSLIDFIEDYCRLANIDINSRELAELYREVCQ